LIRFTLLSGYLLAAISVIAGAAGAHAIKATVAPGVMHNYETAVRYIMFHALGLLAIGLTMLHTHHRLWLNIASVIMFLGTCLFTAGLLGSAFLSKSWGHVAMVGGMSLILSWILAAVGAAATGK
jgi:uncharacterized membrane protein YgdD (TMEM256/DUF423 family)